MFIHFVRFTTQLPEGEVQSVMEERARASASRWLGWCRSTTATTLRAGPSAAATSSTQKSPAKHSVAERASTHHPCRLPGTGIACRGLRGPLPTL
jgi:hypothetical protein